MFFMALVVRLVNDPSAACRDMYEQALKTLLQVQPHQRLLIMSPGPYVQWSCSLCPACRRGMSKLTWCSQGCKGYIDPM